jgi:hypothetical protein
MSFLGTLFTRRNINDPVATCPLTRGIINVEVQAHQANAAPPFRPVKGVTANVQGPSCPAAGVNGVTGSDGRKGFGPYQLGNYTVNLNLPPNLADRYDLANYPVAPQNRPLVGGIATQYPFLLVWHWVEFNVRDSMIAQPMHGLGYKLHFQAPNTLPWVQLESGMVPVNGDIKKEEVKAGQYRLRLTALKAPAWSAPDITIGTPITMTADATGFDVGDAGKFEILDAFDYSKTIHTVNATVVAGLAGGSPLLQVAWTPQEAQLSKLKHCQVVFRAKADSAEVISDARKIYKNTDVPATYSDRTPIAAQVTIHFSDDSNFVGNAAGGQMPAVRVPWRERVLRIDVNGLQSATVQVKNLPDGNKLFGVH